MPGQKDDKTLWIAFGIFIIIGICIYAAIHTEPARPLDEDNLLCRMDKTTCQQKP